MNRRKYLAISGATITTALSGCMSRLGFGDENGSDSPTSLDEYIEVLSSQGHFSGEDGSGVAVSDMQPMVSGRAVNTSDEAFERVVFEVDFLTDDGEFMAKNSYVLEDVEPGDRLFFRVDFPVAPRAERLLREINDYEIEITDSEDTPRELSERFREEFDGVDETNTDPPEEEPPEPETPEDGEETAESPEPDLPE